MCYDPMERERERERRERKRERGLKHEKSTM